MLGSLGLIFIVALIFAGVMKKLHLPSLIGMIFTGILIGPYCLNLIDHSLLSVSYDIRKVALVIILLRAGLGLDYKSLKSTGSSAIKLTIVPAFCEMIIVALVSYFILDFSIVSSLILASVISAVSPAVVVPRMLDLIEKGKGKIPQLVIASSSIEDVLVIVVFSIVISIGATSTFEINSVMFIIAGIVSAIIIGIVTALLIYKVFMKFEVTDSGKVLTLLSISFIFTAVEAKYSYFSSLLAIMSFAILVGQLCSLDDVSKKFKEVWVGAEIILFVIVGAGLDVNSAISDILPALLILITGLAFRSIGVLISLHKSNLTSNEKKFVVFSFFPKATVQAAIAPVALSLGIANGQSILNIAVIAILVSAPIGAILIDRNKNKLL